MVCVHAFGAVGVRARRVALGIVLVAAMVYGSVTALPARAATTNRAAVVVEVNGVIHTAKVTFSTDSISGLDALRSAGFDPLVRVFGGNGGAVCALDIGATTIGCPADNTCLTCDAPRYWAYFRAVAGATQYTYSVAGAGLTQVHDGDVEAWTWSTGTPPSRFVSFRDVWGPDPPPTTRPVVTTPPTTHPPSSPSTVTGLSTPTPTAPLSSKGSATTTARSGKKGSTTTAGKRGSASTTRRTTDDGGATTTDDAKKVATAPVVARRDGGSPYGLVGFGAILAALVGVIAFVRRRRSAPSEELG
jgi:hypothetical protein